MEFNINGTYSFSNGSSITASPTGTIRFGTTGDDNSGVTLPGTYNVNGTTVIRSEGDGVATVTVPATADLMSLGGSGLIIGGSQGELFLQSDSPVTIGSLTLNAGSYLSLSSELTVTDSYDQNHQTAVLESDFDGTVDGDFSWSRGTMTGSGTTFANDGLSISGSSESNSKTLNARHLDVTAGTIDYRGDRFFGGFGSMLKIGENVSMNMRPTNETTTMSVLDESDEAPVVQNAGIMNSMANNNVFTVNWELQIEGDLSQDDQSKMALKIAGTTAGCTYDQISASNVALAGTLSVKLLNDFEPGNTDRFQSIAWPGGTRTGNFTVFEGLE